VFEAFPEAKVVSLTATPFRADGAEVEGDVVYTYWFREAMRRGYIKDIRSENVAPAELYFTYQGESRHHTLDEVLELREEDWFSKGVALAEECNVSIVDASILWLRDLRSTGTPC
jgi:DNA repair protein RadD